MNTGLNNSLELRNAFASDNSASIVVTKTINMVTVSLHHIAYIQLSWYALASLTALSYHGLNVKISSKK